MRVVNFATPGLGGPQVIRRWNGSQGPALADRGCKTAKSEVRPVFFLNPLGGDRKLTGVPREFGEDQAVTDSFVKGLILAQNERWRRGLGMQVERAWQQVSGGRVSKAMATNPMVGYSRGKLRVIPSDVRAGHPARTKVLAPWDGPSWY